MCIKDQPAIHPPKASMASGSREYVNNEEEIMESRLYNHPWNIRQHRNRAQRREEAEMLKQLKKTVLVKLPEARTALENEDHCCVCLDNYPNATFVGCGKVGVCCCICAEKILVNRMKCPHCRVVVSAYTAGPLAAEAVVPESWEDNQ